MSTGYAYKEVSALLHDYLKPLGMLTDHGPLRVMRELTSGIVFTGSVQLSNAARLFVSTAGELADAVERMSLHLSERNWDHHEWAGMILAEQARWIQSDDLIPVDATELAKPYARRMQYLCVVRDASRVGDPLVNGYWCWGAWHWSPRYQTLTPLMLRPYSPNQPRYLSENDLICRWFWTIRQATAGKGIWLQDRGSDRPEILSSLLGVQRQWIVRLREDRALIGPDGTIRPAGRWAEWALARRPIRGHAVTLPVRLPPQQVPQYGVPPPLHLVVPTYTFVRDRKPERWILLTCGLIGHHVGPRQVRHYQGLRWRAEDGKRFLGQLMHVEKFLTLSFLALERMLWCVCLAGGFLSLLQREEAQLSRRLQEEVTYWDDPYELPVYRLMRGLQLASTRAGIAPVLVNA